MTAEGTFTCPRCRTNLRRIDGPSDLGGVLGLVVGFGVSVGLLVVGMPYWLFFAPPTVLAPIGAHTLDSWEVIPPPLKPLPPRSLV